MSFIGEILARLGQDPERIVFAATGELPATSAGELLALVARARVRLRARGLRLGDHVALVAPNGPLWVACDLAVLAEGAVLVPFDPRQPDVDLVALVEDCRAVLFLCAGEPPVGLSSPSETLAALCAPPGEEEDGAAQPGPPRSAPSDALATVIYTSGSSGRPKGAMLTRENLAFMLAQTEARLAELTGLEPGQERALHYLPLCYAGSRVLLLSALLRGAELTLLADPRELAGHLPSAEPDYFLNVPLVLDRFRRAAEDAVAAKGALVARLLAAAVAASARLEEAQRQGLEGRRRDALLLAAARRTVLAPIRARFGPRLRGLICGSAPLSPETQAFFHAAGVPVYQGYGLTETTALCTLDRPGQIRPGYVGPPLPAVELRLAGDGELETRGPHVFAGYWGRPEATQAAFAPGGWFKTGDLGSCDEQGRWRIEGRKSAVLVLSTGHNLPPEPLEAALAERLTAALGPGHEALQVCVVGHGRPHAAALIATPGACDPAQVAVALAELNQLLPPKAQLHAHRLLSEAWSAETGQLTTNLKLRRREIAARYADEIEGLYARAAERSA